MQLLEILHILFVYLKYWILGAHALESALVWAGDYFKINVELEVFKLRDRLKVIF